MQDLTPVFSGLEPAAVWAHFSTLCATPRPSKAEGPLREKLLAWARERGLAARVDDAGNLLVKKPAAVGREGAPGVVLQAHLDMVCQKNSGHPHDFARDPIRPFLRDGWIAAEGTTLGADNGIGVALMLAALEEPDLPHGPLEALFTADEEAGMGGARGLASGLLSGRLMLNLDTEEWGEFYLGCAGGVNVNASHTGSPEPLPAGDAGFRIALGGLRGGHSGIDIHLGRGNAIKLLVRLLRDLEQRFPLRLASLEGGTARNAIPREAAAVVAVPAEAGDALAAAVDEWQGWLAAKLAGIDDGVAVSVAPADVEAIMAPEDQAAWLAALHAAPDGVRAMSRAVPGVVETSDNLGMVALSPAVGSCGISVRSLVEADCHALAEEIAGLFAHQGLRADKAGGYPGWAPNPDSPLLARCQAVYAREFGSEARVQVIHAGLECGLIAAKYPRMDIVSFGPSIRGAHAPGEAVEVASVARTWQLLKAILADLA